jgi:hypothetical protein
MRWCFCKKGEKAKNWNGDMGYSTICIEKNKNCDCKDYKRKFWKFWVK